MQPSVYNEHHSQKLGVLMTKDPLREEGLLMTDGSSILNIFYRCVQFYPTGKNQLYPNFQMVGE